MDTIVSGGIVFRRDNKDFPDGNRTALVVSTTDNQVFLNGIGNWNKGALMLASPTECPEEDEPAKGGATSYYDFPEGSTTLNDLIELKDMSFARGNIFKACYRLGRKKGIDHIYDLNKIIYFAERMKGMVQQGRHI